MSQQSGPPPDTSNTVAPHRNHGLFSDYFLAQHIPTLEGDNLAAAQALQSQTLNLCRDVEARVAGRREASVEEDLIRPVLRLLGFAYVPNPPLPTGDATDAPDYALFASAEAKRQAGNYGEREFYASAIAIAEAKKWDRPLSATTKRSRRAKDRKHPGKQIRDYLYESGVKWGILTNGRLWRLYEREASRGENFYEVDLLDLARNPDPQAWRYFYLFFRRQAFEPEAGLPCPLDQWLGGSKDYALGLTKRLRGNVYKALRLLMEGFFARSDNGLDWERDRKRVHEASLVLLYRLLFVFYAEARGLMPLTNARYRDRYSLAHHKSQIAGQLDASRYDEVGSGLWSWLRDELFELVDKGDDSLGVPQYNGGLFRRDNWPLLHDPNIRLPDQHVAQAIDLLARDAADPRGQSKAFVDYSELGVRELGSIYEGLLEMRPHRATEPMIEVKRGSKDKGAEVIPEAQATQEQKAWNLRNKAPRYGRAEVYLLTDRGERKQTGSYYTPEYIVNYIVENTLGPLLNDCAHKVADRRAKTEGDLAPLERAIAERGDDANAGANRAEIERLKLELLEPYFSLKVLDPAMGSGHFLVGAADWIADAIVHDDNHLPPADLSEEDELLYYKRRVVERCLYGVDINPLAVELAKLSLWLHTVQKDRALSFLDHHLRCGNSLIGAWVEADLSKEPPIFNSRGRQTNKDGQQLILGFNDTLQSRHLESFLSVLSEIEETPTVSAESEARKNYLYKTMDELRAPYRQVANLWLSPYFIPAPTLENVHSAPEGPTPVTSERFHQAVEALSAGTESAEWAALTAQPWFEAAQRVADDNHFFHWELEFPEVWYERGRRKDNPGFDAVMGNPPYGVSGQKDYLSRRCPVTAQNGDLFVAFVGQGLNLVRKSGTAGWIVPLTWQTGVNYSGLRRDLLAKTTILCLVNLPFDVFPDAYVDTGVVTLSAERPTEEWRPSAFAFHKTSQARDLRGLIYHRPLQSRWSHGRGTVVVDPGRLALLDRLESSPWIVSVGSLTDSVRGILPREEDVAEDRQDSSWKPFFAGEMRRYDSVVPSAFVHFTLALPERPASFDVFVGPRLLIRRLVSRQDRLMASIASETFVNKKDIYVFGLAKKRWNLFFLLALVNSAVFSFAYLERDTAATKDDFRQLTLEGLRALPVRSIHFTTPAKERAALADELKGMYREWLSGEEDSKA